jgi:hypothetical protein
MSIKKTAITLFLAISIIQPITAAFAVEGAKSRPNRRLCGRYSLSFSADVIPAGHIAGTGMITSDCAGNLINGTETITTDTTFCQGALAGTYSMNSDGTGTVSFSLVPPNPTLSCPIVNFSEAIAVGDGGHIVKAINTPSAANTPPAEVTIQEEWVRQ